MPTNAERLSLLEREIVRVESRANEELESLKELIKMAQTKIDALTQKLSDHGERLVAVEQKSVALEKLSDRGWGLTQTLVVAGLTFLAGTVVTLVIQLALKK